VINKELDSRLEKLLDAPANEERTIVISRSDAHLIRTYLSLVTAGDNINWVRAQRDAAEEKVRQLQAELEEERNLRQELRDSRDHWDSEEN
jgi:hypothetical protein